MTYQATIDYLFRSLPMYQRIGSPAYKADLENALFLDKAFHHPHKKFLTIHIAGTNGKGSVSHMLASVLQAEGYTTGLYTSPHLLDFRERIKVNGVPVSKQFVVEFTENNKRLFEQTKPSFFEMTVFMAFEYFAYKKSDIAIVEVGLGGRLDTTNIITPEVSVITNISKDHTAFLGNTVAQIAKEKAGIIKHTVPVVIGETQEETREIFQETARKNNSKIYFADRHFSFVYGMRNMRHSIRYNFSSCYHWTIHSLDTDLPGHYQRRNIPTALMALAVMDMKGIRVKPGSIKKGFDQVIKSTGLLGRWQNAGNNPLTICDIAHNKSGIENILLQIQSTPHKALHMVLGFVSDKDIEEIQQILPEHATYYLCEPDIPRAMKISVLSAGFKSKGFVFKEFHTVSDAYKDAKANAESNDMIYIGGSTFVVADFLRWKKSMT
ncbi:MAG: bifunctional folylpolyglutamate synthase/dihydrofolate synthase [Bacteroidales bacterium]|nr:bifunctional folylpolyglutamate synthase/dihydrofolate synthase [Bacteroidales bacterium]